MLMAQGGTLDLEDGVLACQVINQPTVARFNAKQYVKELMNALKGDAKSHSGLP